MGPSAVRHQRVARCLGEGETTVSRRAIAMSAALPLRKCGWAVGGRQICCSPRKAIAERTREMGER